MNIDSELTEAVRHQRAILFVGAGVSKNLGLPTHEELIDRLAKELGFDPEIFKTHGDLQSLAEYYLSRNALGPLRSWIDRTWHPDSVVINKSEIHSLIVKLRFSLIYTTNYDRWLEKAFEAQGIPYVKVVSVADLAKIGTASIQIIKFHGDPDSDDSIVLSESHYFDRLSFESPMDIKFRSDILGRPVLFIGYSLSDMNVRYLLYKLQKTWDNAKPNTPRPRSYMFLGAPNIVQQTILEGRGITPIVSDLDDPAVGLQIFLTRLLEESTRTI
jgi:hypothetical protein